jgi:hypothetical protein
LRRGEGFSHRNILNISRIELLAPTKRFGPGGDFEAVSIVE